MSIVGASKCLVHNLHIYKPKHHHNKFKTLNIWLGMNSMWNYLIISSGKNTCTSSEAQVPLFFKHGKNTLTAQISYKCNIISLPRKSYYITMISNIYDENYKVRRYEKAICAGNMNLWVNLKIWCDFPALAFDITQEIFDQ